MKYLGKCLKYRTEQKTDRDSWKKNIEFLFRENVLIHLRKRKMSERLSLHLRLSNDDLSHKLN